MNLDEDLFFDGVSEEIIRRQKTRARDLKKSRWWQNKLNRGTCYYCNKKFSPGELTMDHVVPLSRGGRSEKNNLETCCRSCNSRKKNLLPQEWTEYLAEIITKAPEG